MAGVLSVSNSLSQNVLHLHMTRNIHAVRTARDGRAKKPGPESYLNGGVYQFASTVTRNPMFTSQ